MLNSFLVAILIGTLLGFLSGLGTGGGSLLILWLTFVLKLPQAEARMLNLMFFIPSAVIACLFRRKQGKLNFKQVIPGIFAGCIAAASCSILTAGQMPEIGRKAFGALLLIAGIREIGYKSRD